MAATREYRNYQTGQVVVAFGRLGVAIDTIARALVVPGAQVEQICRRAVERDEMQMMPPQSPTDIRSASLCELVELRRRHDDAQATIAELKSALVPDRIAFQRAVGLTHKESILLSALVARGTVTKMGLFAALYGTQPDVDQPDPKIVDVFVCKIRKKLAPFGITIQTVWGAGYAMSQEAAVKIRQLAEGVESPPLVPA